MKNMTVNFGFAVLCIFCFLLAIAVGFKLRTVFITNKAFAAWDVKWDEAVGTIIRDIDLDKEQQTGYDLYIPANTDRSKGHPLIVYIHGGGFTSGDKADGAMLCKYFTSKGYICASVNYTLTDGKHESNYNKMYGQILAQVASIKSKTAELGFRVTEMATSGDSAGGYLALLYGYRARADSPIPVKMVFQMTGPTTFEPAQWGITETKDILESISRLSGKTVTEEMMKTGKINQLIKEISPALLIDESTVPTVMAYGPKDQIVPVNLKYALMEALDQYAVDYTYIEFPNSGHGMLFDPDKTQEYVDTVNTYLERYMGDR